MTLPNHPATHPRHSSHSSVPTLRPITTYQRKNNRPHTHAQLATDIRLPYEHTSPAASALLLDVDIAKETNSLRDIRLKQVIHVRQKLTLAEGRLAATHTRAAVAGTPAANPTTPCGRHAVAAAFRHASCCRPDTTDRIRRSNHHARTHARTHT